VFLSVTGAEALYADLGHFGRPPIQLAWIWLVFPALALNYLGQGALILKDPAALENPFFKMVDPTLLFPFVLLATLATVIASQAVITGAYSLTKQAVHLGLLPRLKIRHTSDMHIGQIYLPQVNWAMMVGVLLLVLMFRSSDALGAAYGISVTGTMLLTALMIFFVMWKLREWHWTAAAAFALPLILIDGTFLSSNLLKVADGGWMPLLVAAALIAIMTTWVKGTMILNSRAMKRDAKLDKFIKTFPEKYGTLQRVPGTAFFMAVDPALVPASLIQNIKHNHILHEKNVILSVKIEQIPRIDPATRSIVTRLNDDFSVLVLRFGFKEDPDVQDELLRLNQDAASPIAFDWEKTSVFLSRRSVRSHPKYGLPAWQDFIYIWLNRNASDPSDYYRLPLGRVIEIGRHVII
jgi:KUP system potassium uptake protein